MPTTTELTDLDAIARALDAHAVRYSWRGQHQLRFACPCCETRRAVVVTCTIYGTHVANTFCPCRVDHIQAHLGLPVGSLRTPKRISLPNRIENSTQPHATGNAKPWGGPLAQSELRKFKRRNLKGVIRVAEDMCRNAARLGLDSRDWLSYDTRRAADELRMDRKSVREALKWLVEHHVIDCYWGPAPGELVEKDRGGECAKSGVKRYRPLTEEERIERIAGKTTREITEGITRAAEAARRGSLPSQDDFRPRPVLDAEVGDQLPAAVEHADGRELVGGWVGVELEANVLRVDEDQLAVARE